MLNDGDALILFDMQSAGVDEVVFGLRRSGDDYQLFAGETGATRTLTIQRSNSKWHQVELEITLDAGAANNGTLTFHVDGGQVGAQITGLDQGATDNGQLGVVSGSAASNAGTILIGGIIADDTRIFPRKYPVRETVWLTKDAQVFIGAGVIDSVVVTGTSTDAVATLLDTDIYEAGLTNFSREPVAYVRNVVANDQSPGLNLPVEFYKGVYIQLTGTNPQAWVSIKNGSIVQGHGGYVEFGRRA